VYPFVNVIESTFGGRARRVNAVEELEDTEEAEGKNERGEE